VFKDLGKIDDSILNSTKNTTGSGFLYGYGPFVVFNCSGYSIQIRKQYNNNAVQIRSWHKDNDVWTAWVTVQVTT
jgi:hypothetical protein